jgi:hypothetical protein
MGTLYDRNPTGSIGLGLFLIALSPFAFFMPLPHAIVSLVGGSLTAVFLARRRHPVPHIDPRFLDDPDRDIS